MPPPDTCPYCAKTLAGEPIPESQRWRYSFATNLNIAIGHRSPSLDMVVVWQCPYCGEIWPRFPKSESVLIRSETARILQQERDALNRAPASFQPAPNHAEYELSTVSAVSAFDEAYAAWLTTPQGQFAQYDAERTR